MTFYGYTKFHDNRSSRFRRLGDTISRPLVLREIQSSNDHKYSKVQSSKNKICFIAEVNNTLFLSLDCSFVRSLKCFHYSDRL